MSNWSESEVAAFAVAMKNAGAACLERKPGQFQGEELISYAKLCSLGQKWEVMGAAAGLYIDQDERDADGKLRPKPQLSTAYGFKLESKLHAQDVTEIMAVERSMLADVPYDEVVNTVSDEALTFLQLEYTDEALAVHAMRQPLLLAQLKSARPSLPRHTLFEEGLTKGSLEQYANKPQDAETTVRLLDAALREGVEAAGGNEPGPDDAIPIAAARAQYLLLGKKLPRITYELSLQDVKEKPHINPDLGEATALLLFPDWCSLCVRITPDLWDVLGRLGPQRIRVYALLAEKTPDRAAMLAAQMKPMGADTKPPAPGAPPKSASELLLHTPTLVVKPEVLKTFAAQDFPFLIVVDHLGTIRFAQAAPEDALEAGHTSSTGSRCMLRPPGRPLLHLVPEKSPLRHVERRA